MRKETKVILSALKNFLESEELKHMNKDITFPDAEPVPKFLRGKTVNVPMYVAINEFFKRKVQPKQLKEFLDKFADVIGIFLKYLKEELEDYEYIEEFVDEEELKRMAKK